MKCKECTNYVVITTEYGTVRKCSKYDRLMKEKHIKKNVPKWCEVENEKNV